MGGAHVNTLHSTCRTCQLDFGGPFSVWVDIKNGPFNQDTSTTPPTNLDTGDTYSVHVQKDGGAGRTTIISGYQASRNPVGAADVGFTTPQLTRLIVGALAGQSTSTNLFFDDIYLSQTGYNTTVPRAFGFTTPVSAPVAAPTLSIKLTGTDLEISWSGGTLESSTSVVGGWAPVANAASPSYKTKADGAPRFFRAKQ